MPTSIRMRSALVAVAALALAITAAAAPRPRTPAASPVAADLALIRSLHAQSRWAAADSVAAAGIARLGAARRPDSLAIAELLAEQVRSRMLRGPARDSLNQARAGQVLGIRSRHLAASDPAVAEAHYALAFLLGTHGALDSSFVHARRAHEIRAAALAPDDTLLAESLRLLGLVSRDRSDFVASADYFGQALDIRRRAHGEDRPVMGALYAERGNALRRAGAHDSARAELARSLAVYDRTLGPDAFARTSALDYLAQVERETGNLAASIDLSRQAVVIARRHYPADHQNVIRLERNTAAALVVFGDYEGAAAILARAIPSYEKTFGPDHPRTVTARQSYGTALAGAGDSVGAMRELSFAEAAFARASGPPDPLLATTQLWIGELLSSRGNHAEAVPVWRRGLASLARTRAPSWITQAELQLGLVGSRAALGDTAGLEADRLELLRLADAPRARHSNILQTMRRISAEALRAQGRSDEAWAEALAADSIARERLLATVRTLSDRRALQLTHQYSPTTDLVVEMALGADAARRATAWDAVVRTRGLVAAEIQRRMLPARAALDTAVAAAHQRWLDAQRDYARRLVAAAQDGLDAEAELHALRAAADAAEQRYAVVLGPADAAVSARSGAGIAEVRARLAPTDALVGVTELGAGTPRARTVAFIARGGGSDVALVDLGASPALRAALEPWRERLAVSPAGDAGGRAERATRALGRTARAATWDRLAPQLAGARDVYVVPDGPLVGMAWQALPEGARGYRVEAGPTLHVLNAERERIEVAGPREDARGLLALGDPDFGARDGAEASVAAHRSSSDPCAEGLPPFGALPGTAAEIAAVARVWPGVDVLSGAAATEAALKQRAGAYRDLHIATHGLVARDTCRTGEQGLRGVGGIATLEPAPATRPRPRPATAAAPVEPERKASPWLARRVWLALAGANRASAGDRDENEGLLTAEEVLTLDLSGTDWVVLSACHTGAGEPWSREGALGMRRAFHLAGARAVFASLWSVEDDATREWMEALYRARAGGARDPGAALAAASRETLARRRAAGRSTHPFYWAAFDATGAVGR